MSTAPISGLVLAGGLSRRMGTDKAALTIDGVTLLERAVSLLAERCAEVRVSVRPEQAGEALRAAYPLIQDRFPELGPAAGLLSAHLEQPASAWLVVACDMPLLDTQLLDDILAARGAHEAVACSAADGSGPEPLCALYEPATLAAFLQHVESGGSPSPRAWLAARPVRLLQAPHPERLAGANTKQEFDRITQYTQFGRDKHD